MNTEAQAQKQIIASLKAIGDNFLKASKHLRHAEKSYREASEKIQSATR